MFTTTFDRAIAKMLFLPDPHDVQYHQCYWKTFPLGMIEEGNRAITQDHILAEYFELEGVNFSSLADGKEIHYANILKNFFRTLPEGIAASLLITRFKEPVQSSSASSTHPCHREVLEKWDQGFQDVYRNRFVLVVKTTKSPWWGKPNKKTAAQNRREFFSAKKMLIRLANELEKLFKNFTKTVCGKLSNFGAKKLCDDDLASFLSSMILCKDNKARLPEDGVLLNFAPWPDQFWNKKEPDTIHLLGGAGKSKLTGCLTLRPLSGSTELLGKPLEGILKLNREFIIHQHIAPYTKEDGLNEVKKLMNHYNLAGYDFKTKSFNRLESLYEKLLDEQFAFCDFSTAIHFIEYDKEKLSESEAEIKSCFYKEGAPFELKREAGYHWSVFWSMWPGMEPLNPTKFFVTSDNLANLVSCPAQSSWAESTPWSKQPLCRFKTDKGGLHNFSFHTSSEHGTNGNTLIIGGTGSGKTTLISFLLSQAHRIPNLRSVSFDHFSGMKISTLKQGGAYIDLGSEKAQINPLHLDQTEANKHFLLNWISSIAKEDNGEFLSSIDRSMTELFCHGSKKDLQLAHLIPEISLEFKEAIQHLGKWTNEGIYSNYFSGESDCLDFSKNRIAFDMEKLVDKPDVLKAMCDYLFHRISSIQIEDPSPGILFFDEASIYLKNDQLGQLALDCFRTFRKRDWIVAAAIQSLEDLSSLSRGQSVIENIETFILYPTPSAQSNLYTDLIGLTKNEFRWLRESHVRQVMIKKRSGGSFVVDVDLSSLGDLMSVFDSSAKAVQKFNLEQEEDLLEDDIEEDDWNPNWPGAFKFSARVPHWYKPSIEIDWSKCLSSVFSNIESAKQFRVNGPTKISRIRIRDKESAKSFLTIAEFLGSKNKAFNLALLATKQSLESVE